MTTKPRNGRKADYRLAAADLASFRFDRSTYEDRHWLLLGCMAALAVVVLGVGVIFGAGSENARMILVPIIAVYLVISGLLIIDYARSLVYGRD